MLNAIVQADFDKIEGVPRVRLVQQFGHGVRNGTAESWAEVEGSSNQPGHINEGYVFPISGQNA